ncbi:MAG: hypothetical protein JWN48_4483 [Myxococcaceae bacterium]|nr:hypothetical protein [Myxococcaceae bacterium]
MPERDSIVLRGSLAEMLVAGSVRDAIELSDVHHLYVVSLVGLMPTEDETFFVVLLPNRLWVIPDVTDGLQAFLDALVPRLAAEGHVTRLVADNVPVRWRHKIGGFLPLFPLPRLDRHAVESLPLSRWEEHSMDDALINHLTLVKI